MMRDFISRTAILLLAAVTLMSCCKEQDCSRWSEERANEWWAQQEWPVGCNYVPSYAVNQLEWWQEETYDPERIDYELGLAESLGFNTLRIFLHELLWYADKDGYKDRIDNFMEIADRHGMKLIMTFFTNGGSYNDPKLGPQPQPIEGTHATAWIQTPGTHIVNNPEEWYKLKEYVQDIMKEYKDDDRVLYWCLYNEPENYKNGTRSMGLLQEVFKWAREINPSQPCTSPIWVRPGMKGAATKLDIIGWLGQNCDIITFHCYYDNELETYIDMLKCYNRPMVCQEYMGRPRSTFEHSLPIFKREKIGAINFGLVCGKCGFYMPWGSKPGDPMPEIWFHDIFTQDGTPYSEKEIEFIKNIVFLTEN